MSKQPRIAAATQVTGLISILIVMFAGCYLLIVNQAESRQLLRDWQQELKTNNEAAIKPADVFDEVQQQPHTAHTTNPVPLLYIGRPAQTKDGGSLVDIAPTMCHLLGIEQPSAMTGTPLFTLNHD